MANKFYQNKRFNDATNDDDFYFPMEITDPADKEWARLNGLDIGWARLGFRVFEAIFVPCKDEAYDVEGKVTYLDTPSEVQHRRYLDLIKDEMRWQDEKKQNGRCQIPDGHGGVKRCPCRVPNPDYVEGGDAPKTLPVKCEGCVYERFRQERTTIPFTTLDHENEDGEMESYETPAPSNYYEADRYERLCEAFLAFVQEHNAKLTDLADLLTREHNRSKAACKLGIAASTAGSRMKKLRELCTEFLDSTIIL